MFEEENFTEYKGEFLENMYMFEDENFTEYKGEFFGRSIRQK